MLPISMGSGHYIESKKKNNHRWGLRQEKKERHPSTRTWFKSSGKPEEGSLVSKHVFNNRGATTKRIDRAFWTALKSGGIEASNRSRSGLTGRDDWI
jgi:hypothetical protein